MGVGVGPTVWGHGRDTWWNAHILGIASGWSALAEPTWHDCGGRPEPRAWVAKRTAIADCEGGAESTEGGMQVRVLGAQSRQRVCSDVLVQQCPLTARCGARAAGQPCHKFLRRGVDSAVGRLLRV